MQECCDLLTNPDEKLRSLLMDSFDAKILNIVQRDNRLSAEKIADQVGLSPSAVQRRLKRLRESRVIEAEVAIISPEAVGRSLTAIVGVIIDKERPLSQALAEFKELMLGTPEVMQCYDVTGEFDFIVVITTRDMLEYEAISRRLFIENPNIRRYKTSMVVRRIKSGTGVPLNPEQF
jgi:Lrp/AsnC family transcriptional regulator, leucine-responsive regulatory protein